MNYTLDDAPSQNHHEYTFPLVARTATVTQVPPAKTITFFKKGDPRFGGVRMVVNQRVFKSFSALMDELSHHIPLSFGVRTITTPQGVHCVSSLEQLEDGGCYVCSDRNPSRAIGGSYRRPTESSSRSYPTQRVSNSESWQETPSWQGPKAPKKLTLVKNGDIGFRRSLILSPNTQNLKAFLNDASEVLRFPVNHLYNPDGSKVESLQSLLQGPSIVVCAGQEPFRPMVVENPRRRLPEKLPGLTSKKRNANWELRAKKSVIHSRSESSNRSRQLSLTSEKSYLNGSRASIRSGSPVPTTNTNAPEKSAGLIPFGANDDIEKKVHMNKDGSLSVEMKVRFRLLGEEMLQWSTHVRKDAHLRAASGDDLGLSGVALSHPSRENDVQRSSEVDALLFPDETDSQGLEEACYQGCQQPQPKYEIWRNPVYVSQGHEAAPGRSSWITQSPCSGASLFRQAIHQTKTSGNSLCTTSGGEALECSAPGSSCCSGTLEGGIQFSDKHQASGQRNLTEAASSDDEGKQEYALIGKSSKSYGRGPDPRRKGSQTTQRIKTDRKWPPDEEEENEACSLDCLEDEAQDAAEDVSASSVCSRCREKKMQVAEGCGSPRQEGAFCSYVREAQKKATVAHDASSHGTAYGPSRQVTPQKSNAQEGSASSLVGPSSMKNKVLEAEEDEHSRVIQDANSGSTWKMPRAMDNVITSQTVKRARKGGPSPGHGRKMPRKVSGEGKPQDEKKNLGKLEGSTGMIPSDLPSTSPEEVIYEWLSKIPEESILMSYEMQDDCPGAAVGAPEEDPGVKCSPEVPIEVAQAQEHAPDREDSGGAPLDENPRVDGASPKTGGSLTKKQSSLAIVAEGSPGECADLGVKTNLSKMEDLPSTLYSSVQIMKTLLSSRQSPKLGRVNSLPEVSQTMGRKLSHSAHVLITCLASLHFFDEELMTVTNQLTYMNSPKYQELLSIFQALWTEGSPNTDEPSSKALPSPKLQTTVTDDFTPTSSSGVDVSSGSGGSGEGSVAGVMDCAPFPEKIEDSKLKRQDSHDDMDPIIATKVENKRSFSDEQVKMEAQSTERDEEGRRAHDVTSKDEANESVKEQMLENSMRVADEDEIIEVGTEEEKMLGKEMQEAETQDEGMEVEKIPEEEKQAEEMKDEKVFVEIMQEEEGIQEEEASKECDSIDSSPPVNTEEPTEQVSNPIKEDSNSDSVRDGQELEPHVKEVTEGMAVAGEQSVINPTSGTGGKRASIIQNTPPDPDPLWVLRLLKKIEKEFMTHYVNAMSEFKVRWNLQNNEMLDQMIIELKNEVNQRIQKSIEKELRKIQSRAGKKLPKPPKEAFKWETSLQTEQRRRRLKGMHNHSAFTEQNKMPGKRNLSLAFIEAMASSGTLADDLRELEGEEEYCPCDTCIRKKMTTLSLKSPAPATDAPLRKAFDLQQILLKKKEEKLNERAAELVTEEPESKALQREHTGNEDVDEAKPGMASSSCVDGADAGEENHRSIKDGEPELSEGEEQKTNHGETMIRGEEEAELEKSEEGDKEGKAESDSGEEEDEKRDEGQSVGDGSEKETGPASEYGANSEGEATGDVDRCSEASDGAEELQATEPFSPEAEVEKQTESQTGVESQEGQEGNCQESPGETQSGERSEENDPDQEIGDGSLRTDRLPEALTSSQPNKEAFSSNSSPENCSQASQRGSGKEGSNGDCQESESPETEPRRETNSENKAFTMYPENSLSEQDGMSSCSSTSEKESTGSPDLEHKCRLAKNSKFTEVIDKADVFDDDCLDF
ncbi:retinitis pigmentosa 1-like 1 protein [Phascolarctos cinereus]